MSSVTLSWQLIVNDQLHHELGYELAQRIYEALAPLPESPSALPWGMPWLS